MNARVIPLLLSVGLSLVLPVSGATQAHQREALLTSGYFAFYSDFATNINDALVSSGSARLVGETEVFHQGGPQRCFAGLPPSQQAGWNHAVDYYAEIVSPVSWGRRQQFLLRLDLAGIHNDNDGEAHAFVRIAQGFRAAASPAYRACVWDQQHAVNQAWINRLAARLAIHETAIAQRLEQIYQTAWHGLPLQVDVVATAPPKGANSITISPVGGHILASSSISDGDSLEIVFHEASHTIASSRRNDPLPTLLASAATAMEYRLPRDFWHVALFYLTGQAVREVLERSGETGYQPYLEAHGLWNGRWAEYRGAIESVLPIYLSGDSSLSQASTDLVRALMKNQSPERQ